MPRYLHAPVPKVYPGSQGWRCSYPPNWRVKPCDNGAMSEGSIAHARDVGLHYTGLVIRLRCPDCGNLRWAQKARQTKICSQCLRGPRRANWKGGTLHTSGYRYICLSPDSPFWSMTQKNHGHVGEHRLVMAQTLGRPLQSWERVHHLNGNRDDNRPENLELWKVQQPQGVRQRDYHCPGCHCK